jgi:proteasome lid subunit RPN8/RPN11
MSRQALHIGGAIRRAIVAHAERAAPLECCGFLLGRADAVFCSVEMDNVERSEVRYRIDDAAHLELRRLLRRSAPPLAILGVYHSHPAGEAYPSETDVAEAY